jgi:hypothetical protein
MEKKVKFEILADEYFQIGREMRGSAIKWLKAQLKKFPSMYFSAIDSCVSVAYNGGNHPEYASNAFSIVNGVFINRRGVISLNIEDCSDYELEDVSWEDVYNIAEYLKNEILE